KEALDAAHGHAHNEDGSETAADKKGESSGSHEGHDHGDASENGGKANRYLQIYAGVVTLLALVFGQLLWNSRRTAKTPFKPTAKTASKTA
ncbi:MAG: hypothetical protein O3C21_18735, partial [Verrucomicrobia bacterium]|nr:hypothetical protein [Verrucomicrobiota bacterium]